jgi:uncharacterized integral membrane protein (TIGR00698 family)
MARNVFFIALIVSATGVLSPGAALAMGIVFSLIFAHPYLSDTRTLSRLLLQISVVGLGFGMNLGEVIRVGRSGFLYTAASITLALLAGWGLGRLFAVKRGVSFLVSAGTAICGGSAIAALAPISGADEEEIAVSMGTIFVLNAVALLLFPLIGTSLGLTQTQFGLWAALAIHDTSSVVGAAAKYGAVALTVGTTVKLARALWIVPVSMVTAMTMKSKARIKWPWFIVFFCVAAVFNSYVPQFHAVYPELKRLGVVGLTVTLFLIGTGISKRTLKEVGARPLLQGVVLWVLVSITSLELIRKGWIHL